MHFFQINLIDHLEGLNRFKLDVLVSSADKGIFCHLGLGIQTSGPSRH
jgi:hypothetical protein